MQTTTKQVDEAVQALADGLVAMVLERLTQAVGGKTVTTNGSRHLDMRCRVPGCEQRSGGPRNRYMCKEHQKLPVSQKDKYLQQYREAQH